jgi:hypothetical protein
MNRSTRRRLREKVRENLQLALEISVAGLCLALLWYHGLLVRDQDR